MTPIGIVDAALSADICIVTAAAQEPGSARRCWCRFQSSDAAMLTVPRCTLLPALQSWRMCMSAITVGFVLVIATAAFAAAGIFYARRGTGSLEEFITAPGSLGTWRGVSTLVASGLGAWILFGPAEAATLGGIGAVVGYGLGDAAGLAAGGAVFPDHSLQTGHLLGSFLLAFIVPLLVSLAFLATRRPADFDCATLRTAVRRIPG